MTFHGNTNLGARGAREYFLARRNTPALLSHPAPHPRSAVHPRRPFRRHTKSDRPRRGTGHNTTRQQPTFVLPGPSSRQTRGRRRRHRRFERPPRRGAGAGVVVGGCCNRRPPFRGRRRQCRPDPGTGKGEGIDYAGKGWLRRGIDSGFLGLGAGLLLSKRKLGRHQRVQSLARVAI